MTHQHEGKMQTYTNRLIHESSPYLLQHAHDPVDWYPWEKMRLKRRNLKTSPSS